jgi:hypothetical protein
VPVDDSTVDYRVNLYDLHESVYSRVVILSMARLKLDVLANEQLQDNWGHADGCDVHHLRFRHSQPATC